jgi:hypothetical protein
MSDEAQFLLSGYVNEQNFRYWAPHSLHEHDGPLLSLKVTVWCMIFLSSISHPYFYKNDAERAVTVNDEYYKFILENVLAKELHHCDLPIWFQQDEATLKLHKQAWLFCARCFYSNSHLDVEALNGLSAANFFLRDYLKTKVYETRTENIPDLKQHIWERTEAIPNDLLQCVMTSLPT